MRELTGRLSALDAEATETLKVITYFDKLIDGRVGSEGLLRGAAVLSGVPTGVQTTDAENGRRFSPDGTPLPVGSHRGWPTASAGGGSLVWLERSGQPHANDAMILDRLGLALSILSRRFDSSASPRRAVEVLLMAGASEQERQDASERLLIGAHTTISAVALPASENVQLSVPQALVATPFGTVRAALVLDERAPAPRAGIGLAAHGPLEVRDSWRTALIALRLTDSKQPVVRANDLGVLLGLADAEDQRATPHPDVVKIAAMSETYWTTQSLHALVGGATQRQLAAIMGVHHSTVATRLTDLPRELGYDPRSALGRTRLHVALVLYRLAHVRFDVE